MQFGHAHHDVGHLDFTTGFSLSCHLQNVIPKARAHHVADIAFCGFIGSAFEGVHHLERREPSQITTIVGHRGVFTAALASGHLAKVVAMNHTIAKGLDAVPSHKSVRGGSIGSHADQHVAHTHFCALALVRFFHQF